MRKLGFVFHGTSALLAAGLLLGCGAALQGGEGGSEGAGEGGGRIAGGSKPAPYDAPAHRFTPRAAPARPVRQAPPAPDFASLPPLRMNLGCYGLYDEKPAQIAKGGGGAKPGTGTGAGYGGSKQGGGGGLAAGGKAASGGPSKKAKDQAPAPRPKAPSGGDAADMLGGGGASFSSPPAAEPSAAPPSSAPSPAQPPADKKNKEKSPAPDVMSEAAAPAAEATMPAGEYWRDELGAYRQAEEERSDRARIAADDETQVAAEPEEDFYEQFDDWGQAIYLSNDDSMSLSSAQRVMFAIDRFLPLPAEHIRPHELLNYFSFETARVEEGRDFSVLADITADPREQAIHTLALSVRGRPVTRESRRNAVLTWVIDRSGSMWDEGRMDYLKRGLRRSLDQLKDGDLVHLVLFDHEVCVPAESFVVGRDDRAKLERAIDLLQPKGATDIHRGLERGYELADRTYQAEYENRVLLVTDALANTGVTDERSISMISKYFDQRRIRLSGVGVGREFNDALLDRLTEKGKGAYVFLGSEAEVDAVFGPRFVSLIETIAADVHFRLHLPPSLRMNVFYGEESSTVKEDVQAIHYFAGTSQLFLSDLMARGGELRPQDDVMLTVEYEDPETGDELFDEVAFNIGEIQGAAFNVHKGRLIMAWIDMLAAMAARPTPPVWREAPGMWEDEEAFGLCEDGAAELSRLAEPLGDRAGDPEIRRVFELWDRYCSRYERPRHPVKREIAAPEGWPGAQPIVEPR
jgi:Ca-activated chloride channel family protein